MFTRVLYIVGVYERTCTSEGQDALFGINMAFHCEGRVNRE